MKKLLRRSARVLAFIRRFFPVSLSARIAFVESLLWVWDHAQPLRAAIRQADAPVVISFGSYANIQTILACRGLDHKVIISERNDVSCRPLEYPWEPLRVGLYNRSDVVTANSITARDFMRTYVDPGKLFYIPNPISPMGANGEMSRGLASPAPSILIVANLRTIKAHDVLLEAFARLPAKLLSRWRLSIVGNGPAEEALRQQAQVLAISEYIDWHGQVADPFVHYQSASVFVLPSRSEGMSNALLEAMSCGLAVIVSDAPPLVNLVNDGETGLVVPVGDAAALVQAMVQLTQDSELRRRLGDAARTSVARYHVSNMLAIWEQLIH